MRSRSQRLHQDIRENYMTSFHGVPHQALQSSNRDRVLATPLPLSNHSLRIDRGGQGAGLSLVIVQ